MTCWRDYVSLGGCGELALLRWLDPDKWQTLERWGGCFEIYCRYNPGIKKIMLMVISKLLIAGQYSVFLFGFYKTCKGI